VSKERGATAWSIFEGGCDFSGVSGTERSRVYAQVSGRTIGDEKLIIPRRGVRARFTFRQPCGVGGTGRSNAKSRGGEKIFLPPFTRGFSVSLGRGRNRGGRGQLTILVKKGRITRSEIEFPNWGRVLCQEGKGIFSRRIGESISQAERDMSKKWSPSEGTGQDIA